MIFIATENNGGVKTAKEIEKWYTENKQNIENFAKAHEEVYVLRNPNKTSLKSVNTIDKEQLKSYLKNIGANEKNLRNVARYLYYRSNVMFRLVNWYASMWDLRCRKVTPKCDLTKKDKIDKNKFLKSFNSTLDLLDVMNLQGNMVEPLINVYIQDVYYSIVFFDDTGIFFYPLDPDDCMIDGKYDEFGDFSFAIDMSKWRTAQRQEVIENLGSPLKEMYEEYQRTNVKYIHCPDEYAFCLKFRTDTWDLVVPPFVSLFISIANLEDLVDIQAEADALSIYKLIYLPLKVHSNSKSVDDFEIDPKLAKDYLNKMITNESIPDNVSAAVIPGDGLETIDFAKTVDSDVNSVEQASNQVLQTAGGGAVINANNITSTAAFNAWLMAETEFALSTLLPQINGFANRMLSYKLTNPAKVDHFEVSVYTKNALAEKLLESCQYGYSNKIAYNTLLGISEKETLAQNFLEEDVLELHNIMKYPLVSSYTQSGSVGQGRDTVPDDELSPSGERSRNE